MLINQDPSFGVTNGNRHGQSSSSNTNHSRFILLKTFYDWIIFLGGLSTMLSFFFSLSTHRLLLGDSRQLLLPKLLSCRSRLGYNDPPHIRDLTHSFFSTFPPRNPSPPAFLSGSPFNLSSLSSQQTWNSAHSCGNIQNTRPFFSSTRSLSLFMPSSRYLL
jgi:hypothetical protein